MHQDKKEKIGMKKKGRLCYNESVLMGFFLRQNNDKILVNRKGNE
jgi:hypothetical protein